MKKNLFLILTVLFAFSLGAEAKEKAEMSTPQWISNLEFTNRQNTPTTAYGEMNFPEPATVTFLIGIGNLSKPGTVYFTIGYNSYSMSSTGEREITLTVPKGKIKVEVNTGATGAMGARINTISVNGYTHRPYPVVK